MGTVQVIFMRRGHIGSWLLRRFMWSEFTHCGIVDGDEVIEAMMFKGVYTRTLQAFKEDASKWEIIEIPCERPDDVVAAARTRIGKRYDWFGILGLFIRSDIQDDASDFCSELIAWAFEVTGQPLFRVHPSRVDPRDLYIRSY